MYTEPEEPVGSAQLGQKSYGYREDGWKDQLISYNGQSIEYDALGNPTTYLDMNFTWELGRQLKQVEKNGNTVTFAYDPAGNRIKKTAGGVETRYFWSGDKIIAMRKGNELIHFVYDEKGNPFAMKVNNETYYYIYNGQNDVIGLIDSQGEQVVTYRYDSWGLPLPFDGQNDAILAAKNPFRYRGYCYDEETGLYYLKSRYYDPEVGRFINIDGKLSGVRRDMRGYNLYSYCFNNPVNMEDKQGTSPRFITNIATMLKNVANAVCALVSVVGASTKVLNSIIREKYSSKEVPAVFHYWFLVSYEAGTGGNISFNTGRNINLYKDLPENFWEFWEAGFGIDINFDGYGITLQTGTEDFVSINIPNHSFERGVNALGRHYIKHSYIDSSGLYVYNKFILNGPEILLGALAYVFFSGFVSALLKRGAAGSYAFQ